MTDDLREVIVFENEAVLVLPACTKSLNPRRHLSVGDDVSLGEWHAK